MDLRPLSPSASQIATATDLACRGLLCYQPFIFSEDLCTGVGYEFAGGDEGDGLVYCANPPARYRGNAAVDRFLIDPAKREQFIDCNVRLSRLYDRMIDSVEQYVGPISSLSVADVGCCSGYFPISFARRGSKRAVGFDVVDYTPTFGLLNSICGTKAVFHQKGYSGQHQAIPDQPETFDVVCSVAVLVHLSDPLHHLAYLGSIARRAIVVWTLTSSSSDEEELSIRYLQSNRYYSEARFPFCFDVMEISPTLLRRSLELMGFTELHEIGYAPGGMPENWFRRNRCYVAIRPAGSERSRQHTGLQQETSATDAGAAAVDPIPRLVRTVGSFNLVALRGRYWGIPLKLGPMDLTHIDPATLPGVVSGSSAEEVEKSISGTVKGGDSNQ